MTLEEALIAYLTDEDGDLYDLVAKRVYVFHAPSKVTFPYITLRRVSTERKLTHDQSSSGLAMPRIQFDIVSQTYAEGLEVLEALRGVMQGYKGNMSTLMVQAVLPALEQHNDDPDMGLYRCTIDYMVHHEE